MITVFKVSKPGFQDTRLHLACTVWGSSVRDCLSQMGFDLAPTNESAWPDNRDAAELARLDDLLTLTGL